MRNLKTFNWLKKPVSFPKTSILYIHDNAINFVPDKLTSMNGIILEKSIQIMKNTSIIHWRRWVWQNWGKRDLGGSLNLQESQFFALSRSTATTTGLYVHLYNSNNFMW